jgi:hypothetical protein
MAKKRSKQAEIDRRNSPEGIFEHYRDLDKAQKTSRERMYLDLGILIGTIMGLRRELKRVSAGRTR